MQSSTALYLASTLFKFRDHTKYLNKERKAAVETYIKISNIKFYDRTRYRHFIGIGDESRLCFAAIL